MALDLGCRDSIRLRPMEGLGTGTTSRTGAGASRDAAAPQQGLYLSSDNTTHLNSNPQALNPEP